MLCYVAGKTKSPRVYIVYGRKISLGLVQLNLVSLGTKVNYKEGLEIFLAVVSFLRQFSKVRSSKRDFDRSIHISSLLYILQLCM